MPSIIEKIRAGDNEAIKKLYLDGYHYCRSVILKGGGTDEEANEIFQQAMVILFEKCQDDNFEIKSRVMTYLYGITKNIWRNRLRVKKKMRITSMMEINSEPSFDPWDEADDLQFQNSRYVGLYNAMSMASEECRQLLKLTFYEKLNDRQIAPTMGYTEQFVRNKRRRCIQALRNKMS
jgi:RNA polymerase sigma factor (sigma-70 family)